MFNVAILGAGNIAKSMATALQAISDQVCMYAVASRSIKKAQKFQEEWGFEKAYGNYEELAKDNAVDLVYIATPHSEHATNAKLCMKYGRNCLVEKAFCANAKEAEEIIELAREKKLYLAEAMWTRYIPARRRIEELIEKYVGDIMEIEAEFSVPLMHVERLIRPELAGGALLDIGIYPLTVADLFMKEKMLSMDVKMKMTETGVDGTDEIIVHYEHGAVAKLRCSIQGGAANYARIKGKDASIYYEFIQAPDYIAIYDKYNKLAEEVHIPHLVNGYEYEILEAKRMIEQRNCQSESIPWAKTIAMMYWMDEIKRKGLSSQE